MNWGQSPRSIGISVETNGTLSRLDFAVAAFRCSIAAQPRRAAARSRPLLPRFRAEDVEAVQRSLELLYDDGQGVVHRSVGSVICNTSTLISFGRAAHFCELLFNGPADSDFGLFSGAAMFVAPPTSLASTVYWTT